MRILTQSSFGPTHALMLIGLPITISGCHRLVTRSSILDGTAERTFAKLQRVYRDASVLTDQPERELTTTPSDDLRPAQYSFMNTPGVKHCGGSGQHLWETVAGCSSASELTYDGECNMPQRDRQVASSITHTITNYQLRVTCTLH